MIYFTIFILGILIAAAVLILYARREAEKHGTSAREEIVGICSTALEQTARKSANKEKILALLREKKELGNLEIRETLGVSRRSVVNYLDELEKEGKVEQVGVIGKSVVYRLK